jgi:hypothetical protein
VVVDSFLQFYAILPPPLETHNSFFPTVIVESAYGDISAALDHAQNKLISMRAPEEVRGGGLLKYCALIVRGYKSAPTFDAHAVERYMCSRFFIDFPDIERQQNQFENYLTNHFNGPMRHLRKKWLVALREVVSRGARCVNSNRRNHTIDLIDMLISGEDQEICTSFWPHVDQRHTVPWNSVERYHPAVRQSAERVVDFDIDLPENASTDGSEREMDVHSVVSSVPSDASAELDTGVDGSSTCSGSVVDFNVNELPPVPAQIPFRPYYVGLYPCALPPSFYVPHYQVFYAPVISAYVQRS